jgi:hypothetical protein
MNSIPQTPTCCSIVNRAKTKGIEKCVGKSKLGIAEIFQPYRTPTSVVKLKYITNTQLVQPPTAQKIIKLVHILESGSKHNFSDLLL